MLKYLTGRDSGRFCDALLYRSNAGRAMDSETWEHQICDFYVTFLDGYDCGGGHDYEVDDDGVDENEAELDVCSFSYLHRIPVVLHLQVFAHFRELHRIQHETQNDENDHFQITTIWTFNETSSDRDEEILFLLSTFMSF